MVFLVRSEEQASERGWTGHTALLAQAMRVVSLVEELRHGVESLAVEAVCGAFGLEVAPLAAACDKRRIVLGDISGPLSSCRGPQAAL